MQGDSHYAWVFCTAVGAYAGQVSRCFLHMGTSTALDPRLGNGGVTWGYSAFKGQAWGILPWRGAGHRVQTPPVLGDSPVQILAVAEGHHASAGRGFSEHLPQSKWVVSPSPPS